MATSSEETIALLHGVPAFSTLGEEDLARVAEVVVPRSFQGGEVVFHEGDRSDTCYVVRIGHVRAVREHSAMKYAGAGSAGKPRSSARVVGPMQRASAATPRSGWMADAAMMRWP